MVRLQATAKLRCTFYLLGLLYDPMVMVRCAKIRVLPAAVRSKVWVRR